MSLHRAKILAAGMVFALAGVTASEAAPVSPDLASHLAVYQMSLNTTKLSGGVTGASGSMVYKFSDSCDGWTVENRTALTFSYNEGQPVATTWEFVTWESKDGRQYRYRVRSTRDGVVAEEIDGSATLDARHAGTASFQQPERRNMRLPRGILFPTDHTVKVLEAAAKGQRLIHRALFDGTTTDGPFDVSAVMGRPVPANANASQAASNNPQIDMDLLSAPSWLVEMAFFPQGDADAEPDYEVSVRYYANGVADELIQSFGTFSIKGTLQRLERLPKPDC